MLKKSEKVFTTDIGDIRITRTVVPKGSDEEKAFLGDISLGLGLVDMTSLDSDDKIEAAACAVAEVFSGAWQRHAKEVVITNRSKSWWDNECDAAIKRYRELRNPADYTSFRRATRAAKRKFFDEKIEEIASERQRPAPRYQAPAPSPTTGSLPPSRTSTPKPKSRTVPPSPAPALDFSDLYTMPPFPNSPSPVSKSKHTTPFRSSGRASGTLSPSARPPGPPSTSAPVDSDDSSSSSDSGDEREQVTTSLAAGKEIPLALPASGGVPAEDLASDAGDSPQDAVGEEDPGASSEDDVPLASISKPRSPTPAGVAPSPVSPSPSGDKMDVYDSRAAPSDATAPAEASVSKKRARSNSMPAKAARKDVDLIKQIGLVQIDPIMELVPRLFSIVPRDAESDIRPDQQCIACIRSCYPGCAVSREEPSELPPNVYAHLRAMPCGECGKGGQVFCSHSKPAPLMQYWAENYRIVSISSAYNLQTKIRGLVTALTQYEGAKAQLELASAHLQTLTAEFAEDLSLSERYHQPDPNYWVQAGIVKNEESRRAVFTAVHEVLAQSKSLGATDPAPEAYSRALFSAHKSFLRHFAAFAPDGSLENHPLLDAELPPPATLEVRHAAAQGFQDSSVQAKTAALKELAARRRAQKAKAQTPAKSSGPSTRRRKTRSKSVVSESEQEEYVEEAEEAPTPSSRPSKRSKSNVSSTGLGPFAPKAVDPRASIKKGKKGDEV
ncbi:hypothetical protein NP233_g5340 [Leucocoprinus birnbaumii]|uniref:Uncharacterized protein n=1 Tax=Leucocoprinus birnbaumii TaxID=56174 RepID=A0AAD5VWQ3_9AGAR|nr:hypothetical protein NP233_g5340 [Leucocoprinus birnbaumii]